MKHPDYNSSLELRTFLEQNGMAMQKKFGQNFLINQAYREKIIALLELSKDDKIWEIGPGLGCMTELILNSGASLTVFEIDRGFINLLKQFYEKEILQNRLKIEEGDVLKTWKTKKEIPDKLFGNLPYNIAATFIADTITNEVIFNKCVFTVQKEVAQRIAAKPGTENYSAFSALCQWRYDIKLGPEIAANNFWPKPNVSSQSFSLTKKENYEQCSNPQMYVKTVHALFSSRRKNLSNNIKPLLPPDMTPDDFFSGTGIEKKQRAENLSVKDFALLAEKLTSVII